MAGWIIIRAPGAPPGATRHRTLAAGDRVDLGGAAPTKAPERPLPPGGQGQGPVSQPAGRDEYLYMVTRSLDPGEGRARWTMRWTPALNTFAITFGDRWPAAETY